MKTEERGGRQWRFKGHSPHAAQHKSHFCKIVSQPQNLQSCYVVSFLAEVNEANYFPPTLKVQELECSVAQRRDFQLGGGALTHTAAPFVEEVVSVSICRGLICTLDSEALVGTSLEHVRRADAVYLLPREIKSLEVCLCDTATQQTAFILPVCLLVCQTQTNPRVFQIDY